MASTAAGVGVSGSSRNTAFAAIAHVLALFAWIAGPLVIYVVTEDAFVRENARNAINWQICFAIYSFVALTVAFALAGIGFLVFPALGVVNTVLVVIGAVKAAGGETWDYPLTIDLL
ncbi:DUF4870 domain-containing protein [Halorubrum laminariae]|uniref:DUF4870 domain-containing protein n=1 Tax=Halorubrum laminariae TaxID=1433523 RepID=A0ABD6C653_9EURY|nr:DUF4870 domain-containing protein [Halorubrum laminariae]